MRSPTKLELSLGRDVPKEAHRPKTKYSDRILALKAEHTKRPVKKKHIKNYRSGETSGKMCFSGKHKYQFENERR